MVRRREKGWNVQHTERRVVQCTCFVGAFSGTGIMKDSCVEAEIGSTNSSELERGEDGVDQDTLCLVGRWNHCRNLDATRTSMEGESWAAWRVSGTVIWNSWAGVGVAGMVSRAGT